MRAMIMVVEDEPNIGALVRTYLERAGYQVLWPSPSPSRSRAASQSRSGR